MEQAKIERINELSKKSKECELTPEEKAEQKALRDEYIAAVRANLRAQLENTYIVDEESGEKRKLSAKDLPTGTASN